MEILAEFGPQVVELYPVNANRQRGANRALGQVHKRVNQLSKTVQNNQKVNENMFTKFDHRMTNLERSINNMEQTASDIAKALKNQANQGPKSILVNKTGSQANIASVISSAASSRSQSRSSSPSRDGIHDILQTLSYCSKVLLKGEDQKFEAALEGLRRQIPTRTAVKEKIVRESDMILDRTKSAVAEYMPELIGLSPTIEKENYIFNELPEFDKSDLSLSSVRKDLLREFGRIQGSNESMRHLIQAIRSRYDNRLKKSEVCDLLVTLAEGKLKDSISNLFRTRNVSEAFYALLSIYGKTKSMTDKNILFSKTRVDLKNLVPSLHKIYEAAQACNLNASEDELTNLAMTHALGQLPELVVHKTHERLSKISKLKQFDNSIPMMSYFHWVDFVDETLTMSPSHPKKTVYNISLDETDPETGLPIEYGYSNDQNIHE